MMRGQGSTGIGLLKDDTLLPHLCTKAQTRGASEASAGAFAKPS